MVDAGADPGRINDAGFNALKWLIWGPADEQGERLSDDEREVAESLFSAGLDIDESDRDGETTHRALEEVASWMDAYLVRQQQARR